MRRISGISKNISDKCCTGNQNPHFMFSKLFFYFQNETMWKNIVQPGRLHITIWRMCIACWSPKATHTHPQYVTLTALPLQLWFHESCSILTFIFTVPVLFHISYNLHQRKRLHAKPLGTVRPIYRTGVPLPSRHPILYIFSTNIRTEYFKHAAHSLLSPCKMPFIS